MCMEAAPIHARSLSVEKAAMRFAEPFRIAHYIFEAMPSIVVKIVDGSFCGRGEAAGVYYLGDDQLRMFDAVEHVRADIESGATRQELQQILPPCGARNAIDCALWELESLTTGTPVWELAGVPRPEPLVTTFTIPADDPAIVQSKVDRLSFAQAIKLKLDGEWEADRDRVRVVRHARPDVWIGVDANQGYQKETLEHLSDTARTFRVSLIEQPLPRGSEKDLAGWRPGIPIAADESILDLSELQERADLFDVINIKLDKCGGLTEALAMARAGRAAGKQLMVGNMGGSTLAMAPGYVIAQLCDFIDLDGPYGLADDQLAQEIYADGKIAVPDAVWGAHY